MAVSITTLQATDSLASSRLTLNSNFSVLKAGVDAVQLLLDPTTSILSGVKSATINDAAVSLSTTIFQVGKGSSLLGNVIMGSTGASTSVLINGNGGVVIDKSSLGINIGNLTVSSSTSVSSFGGSLSVTNENRLPGIAVAFSAIIGLTSASAVAVADKKYIVLRNDSITAGMTASLNSGTNGQTLKILHVLGASGVPVYVNASNFSGLTGSVTLQKTGDSIDIVYDGASWFLLSYSAASFGSTAGATVSSVQFTTT